MRVTTAVKLILIWLALFWTASANGQTEDQQDGFAPGGRQLCLGCHTSPEVNDILETPHFVSGHSNTPAAQQECQSCHGPTLDHIQNPQEVKPIRFGRESETPVAKQNAACLGCHESGDRNNWHTSTHAIAEVACANCHNTHERRQDVLVRETQVGVCFECHQDKRQALRRPSHHPVEEGLVVCGDCHNAHGGSGPSQLQAFSVNDNCFGCHSEKQGPFLWEHPPAADDCTNCHDPHGTVQPNMLTQRPPFLCQQCHLEAFHPSELRSGTGLATAEPDNKLLGGSCTNCHTKVHGSNHPSGTFLSR